MLLTQFVLVDTHFVLSLLAALVTFAIAWLYFDAWTANKKMKETTLFFGFLFLAISFLAESVVIDQALLERSILGAGTANLIKVGFRIASYLILIVGQIGVPLQPVPDAEKKGKPSVKAAAFAIINSSLLTLNFFLPVLAATTGFLYLRRATIGLENHQKPISLGFFLLAASELFGLSVLFRETNNIALYNLVAPFGIVWVAERVFLALAVFVFGKWVFGYLLKRFDTQLFMILTTSSLMIFLVTTAFFTYATLKNLTQEAVDSLKIDVGVLGYSIESKKGELTSAAEVIAQNPGLGSAIGDRDRKAISEIATPSLLAKNQSSLIVTTETGEIIFKAEDPEFSGGSLSDNGLVKRAIAGESATGVSTKDGATAPVVVISSAVPVKSGEETLGVILVGFDIDSAFLDGVKAGTGLDASVYADNIRSATTFVAPDGVSRWIGIKEETEVIKKTVLADGQTYTGAVSILNTPYFASFSPLTDIDGNPLGMLFVGRPQVSLLQTAARSLELTFLVTATLLALSLVPSFLVAKYISNQIR